MRDDSIAPLAEEKHLSIPVIGGEWPAVAENDGLSRSPILIENLRAVFRGNRRHTTSSFLLLYLLDSQNKQ